MLKFLPKYFEILPTFFLQIKMLGGSFSPPPPTPTPLVYGPLTHDITY